MKVIPPSELIINPDGTVFHLHLLPSQLTDRVILVGDPARVNMVASFFSNEKFSGKGHAAHICKTCASCRRKRNLKWRQ